MRTQSFFFSPNLKGSTPALVDPVVEDDLRLHPPVPPLEGPRAQDDAGVVLLLPDRVHVGPLQHHVARGPHHLGPVPHGRVWAGHEVVLRERAVRSPDPEEEGPEDEEDEDLVVPQEGHDGLQLRRIMFSLVVE